MDYYKPILTLLISTFIFHILLIWLLPQSKKFWKQIDYLWISLGVIGIIGSTYSLRREYSNARKNVIEYYLKADYKNLQEQIQWNKNYYAKGFNYNDFVDKGRINEMQNAGIYFTQLFDKSIKFKEIIFDENNLEYIDSLEYDFKTYLSSVQDSYVRSSSEDLFIFFRELGKTKNEYKKNEILSEKGDFYWTLLFLSPYLFAIAIGIRLTKVTAEIQELKK